MEIEFVGGGPFPFPVPGLVISEFSLLSWSVLSTLFGLLLFLAGDAVPIGAAEPGLLSPTKL